MAHSLRLKARSPAPAWTALSLLLGAASLAAWAAHTWGWVDRTAIDWQPALWTTEPWRLFTAAAVHYSPMHLGGNLLALLLVALLGMAARLPSRCAAAWLLAIPPCHLALLARPDVLHYGGLSGVLHAGVAVVVAQLLAEGRCAERRIAAVLGAGLLAKVLAEAPWGPVGLRQVAGWDIAVVPWAHASGAAAGVAVMLAWVAAGRLRRGRRDASRPD